MDMIKSLAQVFCPLLYLPNDFDQANFEVFPFVQQAGLVETNLYEDLAEVIPEVDVLLKVINLNTKDSKTCLVPNFLQLQQESFPVSFVNQNIL